MKQALSLLAIILFNFPSLGQGETIGLLHHDPSVSDGYTLFSPLANTDVYLIDNCGEKINQWSFHEGVGATCYLLANGNLLRAGQDSITIHDWNDVLIWSYAMNANGLPQHHDIEPLPNGNILALIRETVDASTAIAQGRDPSFLGATIKSEHIVELEPVGTDAANVVWEWHFTDHLIQNFDNSKLNYGVVEQHPELVDYNFDNGYNSDWIHANALEYNASLDHIMFSSRHLSEIYIIDHSTSTTEAAGHNGGDFGKGGDFLWRWGNPQVYGQGGASDQKLFLQHDPQWVRSGYPDDGKISVFNNDGDGSGNFSSIHLIQPSVFGNSYIMTNDRFDPIDFDWTWSGSILGSVVDQNSRSGTQSQANGNMTLLETSIGRISEVDKMGNLVWSYVNPTGPSVYTQGTPSSSFANGVFRAEKYPSNYGDLASQNLSPQGIIENVNSISATCAISTNIIEVSTELGIVNPCIGGRVVFTDVLEADEIRIVSIEGKIVFERDEVRTSELITNLGEGLYLIQIRRGDKVNTRKILIQ